MVVKSLGTNIGGMAGVFRYETAYMHAHGLAKYANEIGQPDCHGWPTLPNYLHCIIQRIVAMQAILRTHPFRFQEQRVAPESAN